jgi:prostaglandin D2 receptor
MGGMLFSAGLLGNLLALGLLAHSGLGFCRQRPPRPPPSVFYVLVCGLTIFDLVGKCLLSPVVLVAYAQNQTLSGLAPAPNNWLCQAFAFTMSYFGLASTLQLLAMALECWLSLGHPFFYQRYVTLRRGLLVAPIVGAFCLVFCALPFAGFGKYVQYCPGTWCFIQMVHEEGSLSVLCYSVLYSSLMALLVLAIVLCNLGAMRNLYVMHRRLQRHPRCCTRDRAEPGAGKKEASSHPLEELDHLLLLALMTALFALCSLPLIVSRSGGYGGPRRVWTRVPGGKDGDGMRITRARVAMSRTRCFYCCAPQINKLDRTQFIGREEGKSGKGRETQIQWCPESSQTLCGALHRVIFAPRIVVSPWQYGTPAR